MLRQTRTSILEPFCLGSQSCKHPVCSDDLEAAEEYSISKPGPASAEFTELAEFIMMEAGIQAPTNSDDALKLYRHLKASIED